MKTCMLRTGHRRIPYTGTLIGSPPQLDKLARRNLLTLAIESSCDDTCVAVLEQKDASNQSDHQPLLRIHHHEKATSNNLLFKGVHPIEALHSHQENLAKLVQKALQKLPSFSNNSDGRLQNGLDVSTPEGNVVTVRKPDFVTVTRGPGMRANLNVGLDFAKGLAVAFQRPIVGVNHMQAHALTPRLCSALDQRHPESVRPRFPFLSLLVSGGHTILIRSSSLTKHRQLASTADIAIGDAIDKMAREILPAKALEASSSTMYGQALEKFVFQEGQCDYDYSPPKTRVDEVQRFFSPEGWSLGPPMAEATSGSHSNDLEFSFTGLSSSVKRIMHDFEIKSTAGPSNNQRRELAKHAMRLVFEHLAIRVRQSIETPGEAKPQRDHIISSLVVSGGVASNRYLRHILRSYLDERGYEHIELLFPPIDLCVDNAIMIGWTGLEMFEQGWRSELSIRSLRKWSLDSRVYNTGILGVPGWTRDERYKLVS